MSAWDLTRRLEPASGQQLKRAPTIGQLEQPVDNQPQTFPLPIGYCSTNLWKQLSAEEQFQALLATATRAAALETANSNNNSQQLTQTLKFIPQLNLMGEPHLPSPSSEPNLVDVVTGRQILERYSAGGDNSTTTISNPFASKMMPSMRTSNTNSRQYSPIPNGFESLINAARKSSSASSRSLTPSPTSSRSNSTESIDLSLSKRLLVGPSSSSSSSNLQYNVDKVPSPAPTTTGSIISMSSQSSSGSFSSGCSSYEDSTITSQVAASGSGAAKGPTLQPVGDRRARKKDQNRRAAFNYRRKKMEERDKMIEEEARLVHKHVRLAGKISRLEEKILTLLSTKTKRILKNDGSVMCHACPICLELCDNVTVLRNHLRIGHFQQVPLKTHVHTPSSTTTTSSALIDNDYLEIKPTSSIGYTNNGTISTNEDNDSDRTAANGDDDHVVTGNLNLYTISSGAKSNISDELGDDFDGRDSDGFDNNESNNYLI